MGNIIKQVNYFKYFSYRLSINVTSTDHDVNIIVQHGYT